MPARVVTIVGATALLVGLAGCSDGLPGPGGADPEAGPTAAAPTAGNDRATTPRLGADAVARVEGAIPLPGDPQATVTVELLGLQRQGRLLVLTAAVTPRNGLAERMSLFGMFGEQPFHPQLVDPVNLKLYEVVRAKGELQTPTVGNRVPSGTPLFVHATFAAPPADVTTITVRFADQVPAMPDVPIR